MLEPRQNKIIFQFFSWYINRIIKSDFEDLKFNHTEFDKEQIYFIACKPLFLVGWFSDVSDQPVLFQEEIPCYDYRRKLQEGLVFKVSG